MFDLYENQDENRNFTIFFSLKRTFIYQQIWGFKTIYLYSYTCLLFPSGHTKQLGDSPGTDFQHVIANNRSMSEVRRARLNQVSHLTLLFYQIEP